MRSARMRGASTVAVLLAVFSSALFLSAASSANGRASSVAQFDREVHGDVASTGNFVTACPSGPRARTCRDSDRGVAEDGEVSAVDNGNSTVWTDADADPRTYDSSSGRLAIPDGAKVAFATLTWRGDLRSGSTGGCGRGARWPSGSPQRQAVSLSVGRGPASSVTPDRFTVDDGSAARGGNRRYSAHADVTGELIGIRAGNTTLTVGNVWTGQGHDCFGEWSLVVVLAFGGPDAPFAQPRLSVTTSTDRSVTHPGDEITQTARVRNAGGAAATGVLAHLDIGAGCDRRIGTLDAGATATVSCTGTTGEQDYDVTARVTGSGPGGEELAAAARSSVRVLHPIVRAALSVSPATVVRRQRLDYLIRLRNSGDAPLSGVSVRGADLDACVRADLGTLRPGESRTVRCVATAGERGGDRRITVTGRDELGRRVSDSATTRFSVVRPSVTAEVLGPSVPVPAGGMATLTVRIRNTSPIPLASVRVSGKPAQCQREVGELAPQEPFVYACRVRVAADFRTMLTVSGVPVIDGRPFGAAYAVHGSASVRIVARPRPPVARRAPVLQPPPATHRPPPPPEPAESGSAPRDKPITPVAGIIAGLATTVMLVSVGALSRATRAR